MIVVEKSYIDLQAHTMIFIEIAEFSIENSTVYVWTFKNIWINCVELLSLKCIEF